MKKLSSFLLLILLSNSNFAFCSDSDSTSSFDDENFTWRGLGPFERAGREMIEDYSSQSNDETTPSPLPIKYFPAFPTSLEDIKTVLYLRIKGADSDTLEGKGEYVATTQALDVLLAISNITEEALYQVKAKGIDSFLTALENLAQRLEAIETAVAQKSYLETAIENIQSKIEIMFKQESQ